MNAIRPTSVAAIEVQRDALAAWPHLPDREVLAHPSVRDAWGLALSVDLDGCDPGAIRDADHIRTFAAALCDLIEVRRFGPATVVRFGRDPRVCGYSLVQLIETSLVSGHFAEATNAAYIDIFSCRPFPPHAATAVCRDWFRATRVRSTLTLRGSPWR
jgi:S-adenosylmethionine/arginine decarboxylase-like enzyme